MIRFAILSAVSRPEQAAPDKISLAFQEATCRASAEADGWVETSGPFVVDGYSRSFYTNLSDAENDIPPFRAALEAARANRYDILMIYSYDRLGDLVPFVSNEFRNLRKQIYSVSQSSAIQDPATYDPYSDESAAIQQDVARITQRFRINDLRRKWRAGVPARLLKGLTPLKVPFGYRWIGKREPPEQVEAQAALILSMKDWLFAGVSLMEIARRCDASGVKPPNGGELWDVSSVRYILGNPYYHGQLTLHRTRSVYDATKARHQRSVRNDEEKWQTGAGLHKPLWDEDTHLAIVRELERRRELNIRSALRFPLSGLLYCSECGQKLHRRSDGDRRGRHVVLACQSGPSHVIVEYAKGVELVSNAIRDALAEALTHPHVPTPDQSQDVQHKIDGQAALRKRVQAGYESGLYSDAEAAARLAEIDQETNRLRRGLVQTKRSRQLVEELTAMFSVDDLEVLPEWVAGADPGQVHRLLSAVCSRIEITPEHRVIVKLRTV